MSEYILEICANSVESCMEAQKGGAHRVELCAGIPEGGTTPSYGDIVMARELLNIDLFVIIRPRGGDFLYSPLEHEIMLRDIAVSKELGVDGVVFGCLTADGEVDMERNRELVEAAEGMSVTFHRAFDMCRAPFESLEKIINLGINRVLTSGQQPKAEAGTGLIKELLQVANNRVIIMPGGGINNQNITKIAGETGAREFHFSARRAIESGMKFRNPTVKMGGTTIEVNEYEKEVTQAEQVALALRSLKGK